MKYNLLPGAGQVADGVCDRVVQINLSVLARFAADEHNQVEQPVRGLFLLLGPHHSGQLHRQHDQPDHCFHCGRCDPPTISRKS